MPANVYIVHLSDDLHARLYRLYVVIWCITASIVPASVHKAVPWVNLIDSLVIYFQEDLKVNAEVEKCNSLFAALTLHPEVCGLLLRLLRLRFLRIRGLRCCC